MTQDIRLPLIRPDLEFMAGARAADGSPTITVYDPLDRTYDRFSWVETALIGQLLRPATLEQVYQKLKRETTAGLSKEDIIQICQHLEKSGLTTRTLFQDPAQLLEEKKKERSGRWKWLLHHYLYFRIPLLRPDAFLEKTLPFARVFVSTPALLFYALCILAGIVLTFMEYERFLHTFSYFFNIRGLFYYGLTIVVIKTIHEFSHAYTAKARGLRVPVMGVAFIVMWPVAFCDVTDAWRLPERLRRFPVAAAGIMAELIIAGMALFAWSLSLPGIMQSICFVVCTASLFSTLVVNINPAMSFDGYYMLMDLSKIDNLRPRAFAYTSYFFRKYCVGMTLTPPEQIRATRRCFYIFYSVYAWAYRFFLYLSIAALVYYQFTKVLGLFLFCVEIWWVILMPIVREVMGIIKMRRLIQKNRYSVVSFTLIMAALLWFIVPYPHNYYVPAVVVAERFQPLYAPFGGRITDIHAQRGKKVEQGEMILKISSPSLEAAIKTLSIQQHIDDEELQLFFLRQDLSQLPRKQKEQKKTVSELRSLRQNARQYKVSAQISGTMVEWDTRLKVGGHVCRDQVFGKIMDLDSLSVSAYFPEEKIMNPVVGDRAFFYPHTGEKIITGTIRKIHTSQVRTIPSIALTSEKGGDIPVANNGAGGFTMLDARYLVEIELDTGHLNLTPGMSGEIRLKTRPVSVAHTLWNRAYNIIIRESNF